jgi:hypothetical protein
MKFSAVRDSLAERGEFEPPKPFRFYKGNIRPNGRFGFNRHSI